MHDLACEFVKVTLALKIRGIVTSATATESADDGILHQVRPGTAVPWLTILIYISGTMLLLVNILHSRVVPYDDLFCFFMGIT